MNDDSYDDISVAFDSLEARATAHHRGDPPDRICVRDFIKHVEIGAFQAERDTTQRIRFNVVLEVADTAGPVDDVDQILSYDSITGAIEEQLAFERLNLLETLAYRIADSILAHPNALRVFVRIEKLDRIPGALGIDIVRSKSAAHQSGAGALVAPLVVFMPNAVLHGGGLSGWLDVLAAHEMPAIICLEPFAGFGLNTDQPLVDLRIGLLAIEQNAWVLSAKDSRCSVAATRTELDWAMKQGQISVWAPSKIVLDAVDKPRVGPSGPLALANWFAQQMKVEHIHVLQYYHGPEKVAQAVLVTSPDRL
ncbi:MAG: dihydroneopterin aldolase [Rhodobacterales bacterium]